MHAARTRALRSYAERWQSVDQNAQTCGFDFRVVIDKVCGATMKGGRKRRVRVIDEDELLSGNRGNVVASASRSVVRPEIASNDEDDHAGSFMRPERRKKRDGAGVRGRFGQDMHVQYRSGAPRTLTQNKWNAGVEAPFGNEPGIDCEQSEGEQLGNGEPVVVVENVMASAHNQQLRGANMLQSGGERKSEIEIEFHDPMARFEADSKEARAKKTARREASSNNRFGIMPGPHWDGVDRSNGFEQRFFAMRYRSHAKQTTGHRQQVLDL